MKQPDYELLFELMKNSHRSDRQIGKALGISQPTVTRRRTFLEKDFIEEYTVIPNFGQMGFEIAAFTFIKINPNYKKGAQKEKAFEELKEWYGTHSKVLAVVEGQGMGWDAVCVSLHENYTDYAGFLKEQQQDLSDIIVDSQSFQSALKMGNALKPFHLKYLSK
jgi:DNA-binding Lrp family transcriptional regulator